MGMGGIMCGMARLGCGRTCSPMICAPNRLATSNAVSSAGVAASVDVTGTMMVLMDITPPLSAHWADAKAGPTGGRPC